MFLDFTGFKSTGDGPRKVGWLIALFRHEQETDTGDEVRLTESLGSAGGLQPARAWVRLAGQQNGGHYKHNCKFVLIVDGIFDQTFVELPKVEMIRNTCDSSHERGRTAGMAVGHPRFEICGKCPGIVTAT